jgi:hypothetical protein
MSRLDSDEEPGGAETVAIKVVAWGMVIAFLVSWVVETVLTVTYLFNLFFGR